MMSDEERALTLEFKKNLLQIKEAEAKKLLEEGTGSVEKFLEPDDCQNRSYGTAFFPLDLLRKILKEIDELRDQVKELEDENAIIY